MLKLRHIAYLLLLMTLSSAGLVSCGKEHEENAGSDEGSMQQPVMLSLTVGEERASKADINQLTELKEKPVFRGITDVRIVPFTSKTAVLSTDAALSGTVYLPSQITPVATYKETLLYFTEQAFLPRYCASVLLYGKALRAGSAQEYSVADKNLNGSLLDRGFTNPGKQPAQNVTFLPDPMLTETPDAPSDIVEALNDIVFGVSCSIPVRYNGNQETTVTVNWNESIGDENLRSCYAAITQEGRLMPGSGKNVEALLTTLYRAVTNYESLNTEKYEVEKNGSLYEAYKVKDGTALLYKDLYDGLCLSIKNKFIACDKIDISEDNSVTFKDAATSAYPESFGLPSGAAVVRWTPAGYTVPLENGLDGVAPISRICFPPSLYYFANSTLVTSTSDDMLQYYTSESKWSDILLKYEGGNIITADTKSVALEESMHYAVGMLKATVCAASNQLQDNDGQDYTLVDASGEKLPLTGIIIGGQYPQYFNFTPDNEGDPYFLYDNKFSGVYLKPRSESESLPFFHTLALETPKDETVYFCLEFQNNTGKAFYGAEGRILPGHHFYLTGSLGFPENAAFDKVFLKDHVTTVNCKVNTLENAHCAVPDMGAPQLALGVQAEVNWIMSTPVTLIME